MKLKDINPFSIEYRVEEQDLYHYTNLKVAREIVKNGCGTMAFTHIEDLLDIRESQKPIDIYYDLALDIISARYPLVRAHYDAFSRIGVSDLTNVFEQNEKGVLCLRRKKCDIYICCFSEDGHSKRMEETYTKDESGKGICIKFIPMELEEEKGFWFERGIVYDYKKVLYGNDAVTHLVNFLADIFSCSDANESAIEKMIIPRIQEKLRQMAFQVKLAKYGYEKEYRLILSIPQEKKNQFNRLETEDSGIRRILFPFRNRVIADVRGFGKTTTEEVEEIKTLLKG